MKLPFRHGIVKYNVDNQNIPTFLVVEKYDNHVQLVVNRDQVLITFAHNDVNYLYQESTSVYNAWGPFDITKKHWLYWDLNLLTGKRTFGTTLLLPVTSYEPPFNPTNDQHWFDLSENIMKFYENGKWIQCLRVFAGTFYQNEAIAYPLSSQVGLFTDCHAGFIMYSDFDTPHQQARDDGSFKFLTTDLHFHDVKAVPTTVSFNSAIHYGVAAVDLKKNTLITYDENKRLIKASYDDPNYRVAVGVVMSDTLTNQEIAFETQAYVTDEAWSWTQPSAHLYLGLDGQLTDITPKTGYIQRIGYVVNKTTVYIDTTYQIVYHNTLLRKIPIPISVDRKTGKFYTSYQVTDEMIISLYYNTFHNVYQQPIENDTWLIKHTRVLDNFLIQTYDERGRVVIPNNISRIDSNTIQVDFNKRSTGFVKLVSY